MSLVCWVQRISSVPRAGSCADLSCCLTGACPVSPAIKSANLIHFSFVQVLFFQFCPYHTACSIHQEPKSYWSSTWPKMAAKGGKSSPGPVRDGLGAAPSTCSDSSVLKCLNVPADKTVHQALQEAEGFPPMGNCQPALSDCCPWTVAGLGQQKNTEDTHLLDLLPCLTDHVFFVCLS